MFPTKPYQSKPLWGYGFNPHHSVSRGLAGFWTMGNTIANSTVPAIYDATGRYNGKLTGRPLKVPGPFSAAALKFTSTAYGVVTTALGRSSQTLSAPSFTYLCWVKYTSASDQYFVSQGYTASGTQYITLGTTAGKIQIDYRNDSSVETAYNTGSSLADNKWHQFACTANGTLMLLYVDGKKVGTSGAQPSGNVTINQVGIGCLTRDIINTSDCSIDHAAIWSRVLGAGEINYLYARPFAMFYPRDPLIIPASISAINTSSMELVYD